MIRQEFRALFERALIAAMKLTKKRASTSIHLTDLIKIDLHAPNAPRELINFDEALDAIYLGEDQFYKIIDVAVWRPSPTNLVGFVRVSGHLPCPLSQTWDPNGLGPFKPMIIRSVPDQRYATSGA